MPRLSLALLLNPLSLTQGDIGEPGMTGLQGPPGLKVCCQTFSRINSIIKQLLAVIFTKASTKCKFEVCICISFLSSTSLSLSRCYSAGRPRW